MRHLGDELLNKLSHYDKTHPHSILQVPTTQLAKMSIDPKFVELTADVLEIFLYNMFSEQFIIVLFQKPFHRL